MIEIAAVSPRGGDPSGSGGGVVQGDRRAVAIDHRRYCTRELGRHLIDADDLGEGGGQLEERPRGGLRLPCVLDGGGRVEGGSCEPSVRFERGELVRQEVRFQRFDRRELSVVPLGGCDGGDQPPGTADGIGQDFGRDLVGARVVEAIRVDGASREQRVAQCEHEVRLPHRHLGRFENEPERGVRIRARDHLGHGLLEGVQPRFEQARAGSEEGGLARRFVNLFPAHLEPALRVAGAFAGHLGDLGRWVTEEPRDQPAGQPRAVLAAFPERLEAIDVVGGHAPVVRPELLAAGLVHRGRVAGDHCHVREERAW